MSKKNRAQHKGANHSVNQSSVPRRHGDRNVQTRYSQKHQQSASHENMQNGVGGEKGKECIELKDLMASGLCLISELNIKIRELHIHMDERMNSTNFHCGSTAVFVDDDCCDCCDGADGCSGEHAEDTDDTGNTDDEDEEEDENDEEE